jgi:E3 ubiquitin-protein ligase RFWD3
MSEAPSKRPRPSTSGEESRERERSLCSICLDHWTESGEHRLCSLRCGHFFGRRCILQWLRKRSVCPLCKSSARDREIRTHFVADVIVHGAAASHTLQEEVVELRQSLARKQRECHQLHMRLEAALAQSSRLQQNSAHLS